jgi:protein-L-isoaspartate(D-aspartate) O-methyltransferase
MIYPCIGSRDAESNQRLREAVMRGAWWDVRSVRRDAHEPDESCWLHGEEGCISKAPVGEGPSN